MRTLILCCVVGLALGLAAQWLPRAPGATASVIGDVRTQPMQERVTASRSLQVRAVTVAATPDARATHDSLVEDQRDEPAMDIGSSAEPERDGIMQLVSAGFTRDRALEIVRRESQLRRVAIELEYAETGTLRPLDTSSPAAVEQQLRTEMGDDEYEKYLTATGKTTRIRVGDVEADSAAANAGILAGDEIVAYAGRRVFNPRDLNALMLQTPEGETVRTTVVRDGQTMQLYVTGGALGISQSGHARSIQ